MSSSASSSSKGKEKLDEGKQISVLIVANDDASQNACILCLEKCGVETLGVRNGLVAVRIHEITQTHFDLILMSSVIPNMDGIQATKKLRSMGITTQIVGMTTPDDGEDYRKEFMKAGLDECYEKPLTEEILHSLVEKISNKD